MYLPLYHWRTYHSTTDDVLPYHWCTIVQDALELHTLSESSMTWKEKKCNYAL